MEIYSVYSDHFEIRFYCPKSSNEVTVGASVNLIDDVFQNLTTLYFKNPVKVSAQYVIGQLLGTEAAHGKLIGSVVPLATLESLCESAVSYSDILSFLQVCKCLHAGLRLTTNQDNDIKTVSEHSASALWSLLLLSEVFGVHKVHAQCVQMLEEKFATAGGKLVGAVGSVFTDAEVAEAEANLSTYFERFGSVRYTQVVTAAKSNQNPIQSVLLRPSQEHGIVDEHSQPRSQSFALATVQQPGAARTQYIHPEHLSPQHLPHPPAMLQAPHSKLEQQQRYDDVAPSRPQQLPHQPRQADRYPVAQYPPAQSSLQTPSHASNQSTTSTAPKLRPNPHEAHHTYDFNSSAAAHPTPPTNPTSYHAPHTPSYFAQSGQNDQLAQNNSVHYSTTLPPPQGVYSSPQTDWDSNTNSDSAESMSDLYTEPGNPLDAHYESLRRYEAYLRGVQTRSTIPAEPREHGVRRPHQSLDSSQVLRASADFGRATSPAFGSATPRFPPPPSYSTLAGAAQLTPARRAGSAGRGGLSATDSASNHSGYGSASSPQTDPEHEYDSEHERGVSRHVTRPTSRERRGAARRPGKVVYEPEAPPSSSKASLTAEDLRISRDIAKLRLQEAKVREELEASRLRAEREMRENRLRALELKAAVARAPRSTYTVSAVAENTRHNASIGREYSQPNGGLSRSRTPSRSQQLQNGVNSGARDPQPARNPQRFIAEDAQQRAAQRVKDAKKAQERRDAMERAAQEAKQNQKWLLRDRKLEVYKEKQKGSLGFTDYAPSTGDGSEGVSTQWLQGTVSNPQRKLSATPSGHKSEQHAPQQEYRYSESPPQDYWTDEERHASNDIVRSGLYSAEALAAVGLGLSPNSKLAPEQHIAPPAVSPPSPVSIATATDLISLRIVRAWDLPECLGGTSAYVVVDWGRLGKSATHPVKRSTEPHYGSMLQFKSPYTLLNATNRDAVLSSAEVHALRTKSGAEYASHAGPMRVYVYNRNESVSDELIASGELDLHENIVTTDAGQPCILYLTDPSSQPAGCMEYIVKHSLF